MADYDATILAVLGVLALGPAIPREIATALNLPESEVGRALSTLVAAQRVVRLMDGDAWTDRHALVVR